MLPNKLEALSLNPSTAKKKNKKSTAPLKCTGKPSRRTGKLSPQSFRGARSWLDNLGRCCFLNVFLILPIAQTRHLGGKTSVVTNLPAIVCWQERQSGDGVV
jgi:hypothetical protein